MLKSRKYGEHTMLRTFIGEDGYSNYSDNQLASYQKDPAPEDPVPFSVSLVSTEFVICPSTLLIESLDLPRVLLFL